MITSIILKFGWNIEIIPIILLSISLFIMSIIDIKKQEIPNEFIVINLCITFLHIIVTGRLDIVDRLLGMLIISVPLYAIFIFNENIFGGGDIKLMFSVGGILGLKLSIFAFFSGVIFAGIVGVILMLTKNHRSGDHMAFGGYLSMGIFTAMILGDLLISSYMSLFF